MKTKDEWNGITSLPYGIIMGHTWYEAGQILRVVNDFDITAFVEIGTNVGGLSGLLFGKVMLCENFKYLGVELDFSIVNKHILDLRNTTPRYSIVNLDCFSSEAWDLVSEFIATEKCLIYCDGGNKVKELHHFALLLKSNDILMAHDYYDGIRCVRDVDQPRAEVKPEDIFDLNYLRTIENYFEQTRLIGWTK